MTIIKKRSTFEYNEDYKTHLSNIIAEDFEEARLLPLSERYEYIEMLTDNYIAHTGERPDVSVLFQLTDVFLYDYLEGDTNVYKMSHNEYPIMTTAQLLRRTIALRSEKNVIGLTYREVPLESAFMIGSDGNNHALPVRYHRDQSYNND